MKAFFVKAGFATAVLSAIVLPAMAAVINVGAGEREFVAEQQMKYPHEGHMVVQKTTTVQAYHAHDAIEPAAGSMPETNSMMPMNSKAKPAMPFADADPNPLPAN